MGWRRWAAGLAGAACVAALVAIVLLATAAGGSNGSYSVRAIFDDAGNLISGENVKIGGVKVGTVGAVTPTPQGKAAIVLNIENPGFKDFRSDASCTIRPQSLIGEKYVDCLPTQARVEGTPLPPPLRQIRHGEGSGQYLLPVHNTSSPVDVDLLGDINRLPEQQRFTIILNELGAGLAGRGSDLSEVVKRASPALQELDKVLQILANENRVLAKLAVDSDQALQPLAKVSSRVADFIVQSNTVAQAGAATRGALARNLELFPPSLEQLGPALERVGAFAEQTTPTFTSLKVAAPGINEAFTSLPAFAKSNEKFFVNLGQTSKVSGPALVGVRAAAQTSRNTRQVRGAVHDQLLAAARKPAQHRRPRADHGLHLPRHQLRQRLRRARPFPARRGSRQRVPRLRGHAVVRRGLPAQAVQQLRHRGQRRQRSDRVVGERGQRNERADGAHARGAQRRDADAGAREIPGRDNGKCWRSTAHRA